MRIIFLLLLCFISNVVFSQSAERHYTSKAGLSVTFPAIESGEISEGGSGGSLHYIEYSPGGYYWMMDHAYSIDWFKAHGSITTAMLKEGTVQQMRVFVKDDAQMSKPTCKFIRLHNTQAYECQATGIKNNTRFGLGAVNLVINDTLVMVHVIYPSDNMSFPAKEFHRVINSIVVQR